MAVEVADNDVSDIISTPRCNDVKKFFYPDCTAVQSDMQTSFKYSIYFMLYKLA